ncbi:hypothetical protein HHI36_013677 [Cryptolaemus montrouzieri]|uniref:Uncharacterized protein n=1 Tax=Cryptolaemus montrouzieri TaxID=559131 RepID=A0ABD2NHV1_9CUCU
MAYFAMIQPHLTYALTGWGHSPHASRLYGLQRRAILIMAKIPYRSNAPNGISEIKIKGVSEQDAGKSTKPFISTLQIIFEVFLYAMPSTISKEFLDVDFYATAFEMSN